MTWSPEYKVIDLSQIADNLLGYIGTQQMDALNWANGGSGLAEFAKLYTNASGRLQTMFPSLMILTQEDATDLSGDVLTGGLRLTLEGTIAGSDPDELVANTKLYAKATESMLANIPSAILTANSEPSMTASLLEIEKRFDILRGQQSASAFLQIFQVKPTYKLIAAAF